MPTVPVCISLRRRNRELHSQPILAIRFLTTQRAEMLAEPKAITR
jgi:hypothetical protein